MRECPKCKLKIGGSSLYCPLCQNELTGKPGEDYFPPIKEFRKKSLMYKIQLMATLSAVIISFLLDYIIGIHGKMHWSLFVIFWVAGFQIVTRMLIRRNAGLISYITYITAAVIVLVLLSARVAGLLDFCQSFIIPSIFMALLGTQFGLGVFDKKGNVMVYFICTLIVSGIFVGYMSLNRCSFMLLWKICGGISLILLLAVIIFQGNRLLTEIMKRTNI